MALSCNRCHADGVQHGVLTDSGFILIVCLIIFAILLLISFPFAKMIRLSRSKQYLTVYALSQSNTGFIGLPVIKALYGSEAIFFAAIVELINDVLIFTIGIMMIQMSAGANLKVNFKQFLSPGLIGVIIGLILFLLRIELPGVLAGSIEMIGNATTPLTMFVIGFQLGGLKIKDVVSDWQVYAVCFMKLIIVPLISLVLLKLWVGELTLLEKILIIEFAMPVASVSAIFSQQYKGETAFATKSVLLSTVLSLVTISLFAIIMEL